MATKNFYIDFDIKNIVIKASKDDLPRVLALKNNSFDKYEEKSIINIMIIILRESSSYNF